MDEVIGTSKVTNTPGVSGENLKGVGVRGVSRTGSGVTGTSTSGVGVWGESQSSSGVGGRSDTGIGVHGVSKVGPGVRGDADNGVGVFGGSKTSSGVGGMTDSGIGVHGVAKTGIGVRGDSETWQGVYGHSTGNAGIVGESKNLHGVFGICHNPNGAGAFGTNDAGGFGIQGDSKSGRGVFGHSETGEGIHGETNSPTVAAIAGVNLNPKGTGAAIYGEKQGDVGHAGFFKGDVHVTGNLTADGNIVLPNADCAEDFDIADAGLIEAGTVMVLGDEGALYQSHLAYDRRVAGVVSGAGDYKPGIVLDKRPSQSNRRPIALLGKVYCKADAKYDSIEVGDLLTTSSLPGHAMKAVDQQKAFGAVIGKALGPLKEGHGLIPILIALQ